MSPYGMASAILPAVRRPIGNQLSLNELTDFEVKVVCLSAFTFSKADLSVVAWRRRRR